MNSFTRIAIGALALYYLCVLFLAITPDVSDDYRQYYITRTSDLSPVEKRRLVPLRPNVSHSHLEKSLVLEGWAKATDAGRWNTGKKARIIFCLDDGSATQELLVGLRPARTSRIRWSFNEGPTQEFILTQDAAIRLPLDANTPRPGINRLAFEFPDVHDRPKGTSAAAVEFYSFTIQQGT